MIITGNIIKTTRSSTYIATNDLDRDFRAIGPVVDLGNGDLDMTEIDALNLQAQEAAARVAAAMAKGASMDEAVRAERERAAAAAEEAVLEGAVVLGGVADAYYRPVLAGPDQLGIADVRIIDGRIVVRSSTQAGIGLNHGVWLTKPASAGWPSAREVVRAIGLAA